MRTLSFAGRVLPILAAASVLGLSVAAMAQSQPDLENGRFSLSPVADGEGVLRLDTRTGAVSTCSNSSRGWACYTMPDERAALDAEIGRLQRENAKLKADLAKREPIATDKIDEALPKQDSLKPPQPQSKAAEGERKIEIPLPSDRDMDRVMSLLGQAWQRLLAIATRVQRDVRDKI